MAPVTPRRMGVREFRREWTNLSGEVVRVEARGRLLGHWIPADNGLSWEETPVEPTVVTPTVQPTDLYWGGTTTTQMTNTVQPPAQETRVTFSPAPKPGAKRRTTKKT